MTALKNEIYENYQKFIFMDIYQIQSQIFSISTIKNSDIRTFKILGILDKKVLVGFSQKLRIFAYFDQHAMH